MSAEDSSRFSIFDFRPFTYFWFARVFGQIALQMQTVAVGWQVYDLTSRPLDLGYVGLSQFFATVVFILLAGQAADRYDRRNVVCVSQIVVGAAMAALMVGTAGGFQTRDLILGIVFVIGAARAFEQPTQQSLLPALVPPPVLSRAVAASSASNQIATIMGPAIGGLLYAVSPTMVYAICAGLYLLAFVLMSLIRIDRPPPRKEPMTFEIVFAGIHFIRRNPIILGAITLDLFAVLFGGATALLPVFAKDIFHTDAWGLGLLRLSPAIGALAMSLVLARMPMTRNAGRIMFAAVAAFGLATMIFALSKSFALSMVALAFLGAADLLSVVVRQTLIQLRTPDAMRGRVSAVNSLFVGTSNQLGEFESGLTAALWGTVPAVFIGGLGTLLVVLVSLKIFPALARVDTMEKPVEET